MKRIRPPSSASLPPPKFLPAVVLCLGLIQCLNAFVVPGTYPQEYRLGDSISAQVNSLKSFDTAMPFEYYTMPFCKPMAGVKPAGSSVNPGMLLEGLRIETSPYNFKVKVRETAKHACEPRGFYGPLTEEEVNNVKHKIDNNYRVNMLLDNLPVTVYDLLDKNQEFLRPGYQLGFKRNGKYYLHNHLVFNVLVSLTHGEFTLGLQEAKLLGSMEVDPRRRMAGSGKRLLASGSMSADEAAEALQEAQGGGGGTRGAGAGMRKLLQDVGQAGEALPNEPYYMIVGFEVSPCSVHRVAGEEVEEVVCGMDDDSHILSQEVVAGAKIVYTYDVYWQESSIKWASRWDSYLRMPGGKVHWFSILNSVLVVLIMATMVAVILIRTVRRDLTKYESLVVDPSEIKDEAGWKLVSGDAFRAPSGGRMLSVLVGAGVQIIFTFTVTLLLAALGFLSPASRGAMVTTAMVLFVWLALVAGFSSVAVWGLMERSYAGWPWVCGTVSVFYPGIVIAIFTVMNLMIFTTGTSGAIPIGMYFIVVLVWFVVSVPLTVAGGYAALKIPILDPPVKTNQIPRHIPPPAVAASPLLLMFAAGVLPFATIFVELYFAMTSIWLGYFYYLFGFVFLISCITAVINAEISVLCTYVQLCSEDYHWWWQSFNRGGSVAAYVALYAMGFLINRLPTMSGMLPMVIYLCYMAVLILGLYIAMGTIGFVASYVFVYFIFKAVKSD